MNLAKIEVSFNPADPKQMKALNAFLKTTAVNIQESPAPIPAPAKAAAAPAKEKAAPPKAAEETSEIGIDDVRKLLSEKVKDHREAIKAKLGDLGAANVSSLDASHYGTMHAFLAAL